MPRPVVLWQPTVELLACFGIDGSCGLAVHSLGIEVYNYARLYGVDADSVYLEHTMAREPIVCEDVDTLVLALGHESNDRLETELESLDLQVDLIGDALAPRTAEEAIFEGLKAGNTV